MATQYPRHKTFYFFYFLFLEQQTIDATTMLITLIAFGLKFAYGVHTQPWLLNNLNHWSKIYFITGTIQQKVSPKLEIFSTFFFGFPGSAAAFS